ncbi:MAG: hypothetical protein ABR606_12130 [Vicinamibacterales bacterium]
MRSPSVARRQLRRSGSIFIVIRSSQRPSGARNAADLRDAFAERERQTAQ